MNGLFVSHPNSFEHHPMFGGLDEGLSLISLVAIVIYKDRNKSDNKPSVLKG